MSKLFRASLAVHVALVLAGCGGGGQSPTEPAETYFLVAAGAMGNESSRCCLRSVEVVLDGRAVQTFSFPQNGGVVVWNVNADAAQNLHQVRLEPGRHEIMVTVVEDATAPSAYFATGDIEVRDSANNVVLRMELPLTRGRFGRGAGPSWVFSF